jgi:hypothetical protein
MIFREKISLKDFREEISLKDFKEEIFHPSMMLVLRSAPDY